jgi:hypothetical protein
MLMGGGWQFGLVLAGLGLGYALEPWPLVSAGLKLLALGGAIWLFWRAPAGVDFGRAFRALAFGLLLGLLALDLGGRFAGWDPTSRDLREILLVYVLVCLGFAGLGRRSS